MSQPEPSSEIVETDVSHTVVLLRGEHDLSTVSLLTREFDRAIAIGEGQLAIDLRRVDFMDATTVDVVLRASEHLARQGRTLVLRAPSNAARRLIDLCGLTELLEEEFRGFSTRLATLPHEHRTGALGSWVEVTPSARVDGCSHVGTNHTDDTASEHTVRERAAAVDESAGV